MRATSSAMASRYPPRCSHRSNRCGKTSKYRKPTLLTRKRKSPTSRRNSATNWHTTENCAKGRRQGTRSGARKGLERQRQLRVERKQLLAKHILYTQQCHLIVGIKTQHQHRRCVRCAHQPPAVRPVRTYAIDGGHACALEAGFFPEFLYEAIVLAFCHRDFQFGRTRALGQAVEYLLRR